MTIDGFLNKDNRYKPINKRFVHFMKIAVQDNRFIWR